MPFTHLGVKHPKLLLALFGIFCYTNTVLRERTEREEKKMEYRKEQNFIVAYDNDKIRGKWNILTNEYIGVKGSIVKNIPSAFSTNNLDTRSPIASIIILVHDHCDRWNPYTPARAKRIEEILSLNLRVSEHDWYTWRFIETDRTRLTKECINFLNENCNGVYSCDSITNFKFYKKYNDILVNIPEENKEWAIQVIKEVIDSDIPKEFIKGMIIRGIHEKVFATKNAYEYSNLISTWFNHIRTLNDKLEVKHNILTNYTILCWLAENYKQEHYDEMLKRNNDKECLYFENDEFIVRPLLTRAEFHDEAEYQHNCVERMYMERVYNGTTHVVVVRFKNRPDVPFITCEVSNNGTISQYLTRCTNTVSRESTATQFKEEYKIHLKNNWEK